MRFGGWSVQAAVYGGQIMAAIEAENALETALGGKVRRKSNNTRGLKSKAGRVAKGSTEVMLKISSFGSSANVVPDGLTSVKGHLQYISRNGDVELETERGEILASREDVKSLAREWKQEFDDTRRHKQQRDTMHMILSMPEGTPQEAVRRGARAFLAETFAPNHGYVFALHTDEPHPHVHVTVKMRGFDGTRLNPRKDDLQAWREGFALAMRDQGVDAEASPRASRGVVRKAERQVLRHIEHRTPSRVSAAKVKEVADELTSTAGTPAQARPWEERIRTRQNAVRQAWLSAAEQLEQAPPIRNQYAPKDTHRASPNYDISPDAARRGQRAAAVYQSDLERNGRKAPALALARLRNVSRIDVVHNQRPAQVFLHTHASADVGRSSGSGDELRRPRAGADRTTGAASAGVDGVTGYPSRAVDPRELAASIRGLVERMPKTIETERHVLAKDLASRFSKQGLDVSVAVDAKDRAATPPGQDAGR